ncbi:hypothetical protein V6Z11_D08G113300 [Gossypium hirsutum]|uniref:Defensin-like protein 263 n=1 Tax=Gossypium darwinii TaxID=34276 RepID=A0A5D2BM73_GOSDA|nr:hypothetical protein ES288_D08G123500v1 [Gossypium darwinii]
MKMTSFGIATLLFILIAAYCVSNLVAQEKECSGNIDCASKCKAESLGICELKIRKFNCLPTPKVVAKVVLMVDAKCKKDVDCAKVCPPGCKIHNCINGTCFCECSSA